MPFKTHENLIIMNNAHHYEVDLTWTNDRKGTISSPVLNSSIEVATPPEFPKGIPGIWSPEHLLVAAVNSCYMTTVLLKPVLVITDEHQAERAMRVLEKTEKACLISNSIKSTVKLDAIVKVTHAA